MKRLALVLALASTTEAQRIGGGPLDTVDVEVAYVKFLTRKPEELDKRFGGALGKALKGITVRDREMFPRWKHHKLAYRWVPGGAAGARKHVIREIKVGKLLRGLMDGVTPSTDLAAVCKKNGLSFHRYKKATRRHLQVHPGVGNVRAMMMIWGVGIERLRTGKLRAGMIVPYVTRTQTYWPDIFDEPGNFMALFRIMKHHPAKK